MKTRICSWAAGFGLSAMAYYYFPSWKECAVFLFFYVASVVLNTMNGMRIFGDVLVHELEKKP